MSVFTNRIELNNKLKLQENEIQKLKMESEKQLEEIADLKKQVIEITSENRTYEEKYLHTGLECEFCYATIQKGFAFCPRCGKKIEKSQKTETRTVVSSAFQTENDRDGLLINQYNGFDDKKIIIPSSINGKPVIGIWNGVFEKCTSLEEVIFEEGCKYIGHNAFANCTNLKKVRLPKSLVEIGDAAFSGCAIEEMAVPPNVTVIGGYAFSSQSLRKIILPDGLKYISNGMLSYTSIKEIDIPQSVVHIGYSAFAKTRLKEIELPHNLYSIGEYAFEIPSLEKITIYSNVKTICKDIFENSAKPVICCSAGSKAHLYARKYGMNCSEIPPQPKGDVQVCASSIILVLGSWSKTASISDLYRLVGINKAATWSWTVKRSNQLIINKMMDMDDAEQLKNILQNYINTHSDYPRAGVVRPIRELSVCKHWGDPDV